MRIEAPDGFGAAIQFVASHGYLDVALGGARIVIVEPADRTTAARVEVTGGGAKLSARFLGPAAGGRR